MKGKFDCTADVKAFIKKYGDGVSLKNDVEKTIESVGQLAREGMRETDAEILDIMLDD